MQNKPSTSDPNDKRKTYDAPRVSTYSADELRAFLGVAYAMSSGGGGGGEVEQLYNNRPSRRGSSFGRD